MNLQNLVSPAAAEELVASGDPSSRPGHHRRYNPPNGLRTVLTRRTIEHVRTLEAIRSGDTHLPLIAPLRTDNQYLPITRPIGKNVIDDRFNLQPLFRGFPGLMDLNPCCHETILV